MRPAESWTEMLRSITSGTSKLDSEQRKALQVKIGDAGFRAIGRVGIAGTNEPTAQGLASRCSRRFAKLKHPACNWPD